MRHIHPARPSFAVDENGRRWPIPAGGSSDDPPPTSDDGDPPPASDGDGDDDPPSGDPDALGDAGKRALDAERQARKDAEKRAKAAEAKAEAAERAQMDEAQRAQAEAVDAARAEVAASYSSRLAAARAEALAATRTHDPEAAVQLLGDLTTYVTDDGDVDLDAMSKALDDLVDAKPYLKPAAATAVGGADQGRRPPPAPTRASSLEEAATAHYDTSGKG